MWDLHRGSPLIGIGSARRRRRGLLCGAQIVVGKGGMAHIRQWPNLEFIQRNRYGLLELGIASLTPRLRIKLDLNIRLNAVVFNFRLLIGTVESHTRCRNLRAIDELRIVVNSNQPSPGTSSY